MNTRGCTAVWCRIRSDLYVQIKVVLNRGFEFLLPVHDVSLSDRSAAVLQERLNQGHVTAVLYRFWEKHHFSAAVSCLTVILYQSIIVSVGKNLNYWTFWNVQGCIGSETDNPNPFFSAPQKVFEMTQISRTFLYLRIHN